MNAKKTVDDLVDGPLTGLRVLDLSRILAGPFCSMSLADMGAAVIKVERPGGGDDTRRFGPPFVEGVSTYFLSVNRNKRSLALDMKTPEGARVLWALVERADVLLENFRPGALERLGFGYEACVARNPRLVYCSISAYGHEGLPQWSRRPGYDVIMQGMGGIPSVTGPVEGPPFKVGASIADVAAGMWATQGILLALLARARTGRGQRVDQAMLDGQVALLTYLSSAWLNTGEAPPRLGNGHLSVAPYNTYAAADGYLNLAAANDALWARLCEVLERPDLAADERFASNPARVQNVAALDTALGEVFATRTVAEWIDALDDAGVPAGPILGVDEVLQHPQLLARDMVRTLPHPTLGEIRVTGVPVKLSETPGAVRTAPPEVGEHTEQILAELGYDGAAIAELRAAGVVA